MISEIDADGNGEIDFDGEAGCTSAAARVLRMDELCPAAGWGIARGLRAHARWHAPQSSSRSCRAKCPPRTPPHK